MTRSTAEAEFDSWLALYSGAEIPLAAVLCDDHAESGATALILDGAGGESQLSYAELRDRSTRLAGVMAAAGVRSGDRVAVLLPKSAELLVALLAIWRLGAVHVPLFTAFGRDGVDYRLAQSRAQLVVTDAANRAKVTFATAEPAPVICAGLGLSAGGGSDLDFEDAAGSGDSVPAATRRGDDLLIVLYTSGTTGLPKGVSVPIRALAATRSYMRHGLDLRPDDVYWNMADPGWAYGLYYGVIGPLLLGQTIYWRTLPFDAKAVYDTVATRGVTNLAGAPTVFRAMRSHGVPDGFRDAHWLRAISSAGEPLNAELLEWSERELGLPILDHFGQSELGMVVYFSQAPGLRREPVSGSMGTSAPACRAVVLDGQGDELGAGEDGELAIDGENSPLLWFREYFDDPWRSAERFVGDGRYYLTGDAARLGADGLLYFTSRADDVITSSGYRVGPFEVESALMAHPAVAEVAVIGTSDELRGEAITAYVMTAPGSSGSDELADDLRRFVGSRLSKHLSPRNIVFIDELPKTPSGKVQRTVLRERWRTGDRLSA